MKSYIPTAIVLAAVIVVLVIGPVFTRVFEDPQQNLDRRIDEKVAAAQRMLASYSPQGTRLQSLFSETGIAVPEQASQAWSDYLGQLREDSPISGTLRQQERSIQQLNRDYESLAGQRPETATHWRSGSQAYNQLRTDLTRNESLLNKALTTVQEGIAMSDGEFSGSGHPAATRLEAILYYHQADLKRRQAALEGNLADGTRQEFWKVYRRWDQLETKIQLAERELGLREDVRPAVSTGPAVPEDDAPRAVEPGEALTLPERIALLRTQRKEADATLPPAREQVRQMEQKLAVLRAAIATAKKHSRQAQQRMFELRESANDAADSESLDRFIAAYEDAAQADREAFREAITLEKGALRNAHVKPGDIDDLLQEPLTPINPTEPIDAQTGADKLAFELDAVKTRLAAQEAVIAEIDRQIEELTIRQQETEEYLASLRQQQADTQARVEELSRQILAALSRAVELETEAVETLLGRGLQAAKRARTAAAGRISDARTANADNSPQSPNPRLEMIISDGFMTGHSAVLTGDLPFLAVRILAQRIEQLERQQTTIRQLQTSGLAADPQIAPEGMALEQIPAALLSIEASQSMIAASREQAVEAGTLALEGYDQADGPLRQLWLLHANMAGVNGLLAELSTGATAREYRNAAIVEYRRAMQDRTDRPEYPILKAAEERLAAMP